MKTRDTLHGRNSQSGFTLLEVLVALAILLIGLTSILVLFPQSLSQAGTANRKSQSADAASAVLGEVSQLGADYLYYDQVDEELLHEEDSGATFRYHTTTQRYQHGSADSKLQRVTYSVSYPNGTQQSFVTYVVKP